MKFRFPHPLTLLVGFIGLAAVMSYLLPAGQFDRRDDPVTGRKVVRFRLLWQFRKEWLRQRR